MLNKFNMKYLYLVIIILASTQLEASKDIVKLYLKPPQCVSLNEGQDCYVTIELSWSGPVADYCLFASNQKSALKCWQSANKGEYKKELVIAKNIEYTLRSGKDKASGEVLASTRLEVAWVYRKNSRSLSSWRLF